jgi:hypothetical protein
MNTQLETIKTVYGDAVILQQIRTRQTVGPHRVNFLEYLVRFNDGKEKWIDSHDVISQEV